jgi:pyrroloquinoline quinone biosynthesis protein E
VKDRSLREIWEHSAAFQKFRGEAWMQEPCKTCDRRELDFGGCRCQALLLAGDAAATDPVCSLAPLRPKVDAILAAANLPPVSAAAGLAPPANEPLTRPSWLYRPNPA